MCAMQTQWRVGPGGAYGLDYNVLPLIWKRLRVSREKRDRVFDDLQEMESAALAEMNKK